jgi:hypothetical protein
MNGDHVGDVDQAFNIIHEERRRMRGENIQLRSKVNQQAAQLDIIKTERDDLRKQVAQLRAHVLRSGANVLNMVGQGVDITDHVTFVDEGKKA